MPKAQASCRKDSVPRTSLKIKGRMWNSFAPSILYTVYATPRLEAQFFPPILLLPSARTARRSNGSLRACAR